jgi:hypothetical protein
MLTSKTCGAAMLSFIFVAWFAAIVFIKGFVFALCLSLAVAIGAWWAIKAVDLLAGDEVNGPVEITGCEELILSTEKTSDEHSGALGGYPASYREQDGCHNCMQLFRDGGEHFCARDAPTRPNRMPGFKDCDSMTIEELDQLHEDWQIWEAGRAVESFGICEQWEAT